MSMKVESHLETGHLAANMTGEFSLDAAKRVFLDMLDAVARHRCLNVLVDGRTLTGEPETMERFFYGEFTAQSVMEYKDRGVSRATHFAYVLKEPVRDPRRFGETVAVNRGMFVKTFDNIDDARQWLAAAPPTDVSAQGRQRVR